MHWHRHVIVAQTTVTSLLFEDFRHSASFLCVLNNFTLFYMYIYVVLLVCACVCCFGTLKLILVVKQSQFRETTLTRTCVMLFQHRLHHLHWRGSRVTLPIHKFNFFVKIEKGIFGNDCFWGCATQLLWMQLIPRGSYVCSYARVV